MSNTTSIQGFGPSDLATGEARVYNYYTNNIIMSVGVHALHMDEAASVVFAAIKKHVHPDVVCSIEIDQMPYSEVHPREEEIMEQEYADHWGVDI